MTQTSTCPTRVKRSLDRENANRVKVNVQVQAAMGAGIGNLNGTQRPSRISISASSHTSCTRFLLSKKDLRMPLGPLASAQTTAQGAALHLGLSSGPC